MTDEIERFRAAIAGEPVSRHLLRPWSLGTKTLEPGKRVTWVCECGVNCRIIALRLTCRCPSVLELCRLDVGPHSVLIDGVACPLRVFCDALEDNLIQIPMLSELWKLRIELRNTGARTCSVGLLACVAVPL